MSASDQCLKTDLTHSEDYDLEKVDISANGNHISKSPGSNDDQNSVQSAQKSDILINGTKIMTGIIVKVVEM